MHFTAPSHYYVSVPLLVVVDIQFSSVLSCCDLDYLEQELSLIFIFKKIVGCLSIYKTITVVT